MITPINTFIQALIYLQIRLFVGVWEFALTAVLTMCSLMRLPPLSTLFVTHLAEKEKVQETELDSLGWTPVNWNTACRQCGWQRWYLIFMIQISPKSWLVAGIRMMKNVRTETIKCFSGSVSQEAFYFSDRDVLLLFKKGLGFKMQAVMSRPLTIPLIWWGVWQQRPRRRTPMCFEHEGGQCNLLCPLCVAWETEFTEFHVRFKDVKDRQHM